MVERVVVSGKGNFVGVNRKARDCLGDLVVDGGAILTWDLEK
jgi:hypothetical protein